MSPLPAVGSARIGTARLDDYEVIGALGEGGMATVARARVRATGEEVALKKMLAQYGQSEVFVERFVREVSTSAKLLHPHIVRVHGWGFDDDVWFLALELCAGGTLSNLLKSQPRLPPQAVVLLLEELLDAFACAHDAGVVHRDLKPPNVLLSAEGRVKLSDFGIARTVGEQTLTATGDVIGTPAYMSPEQARGARDLDGRSDLFALGVLAYRLLVGGNPYASDNIATSLLRLTTGPSLVVGDALPALPAVLERVIDGLVQKDLAARTPSARAALDVIRPLATEIRRVHPDLQRRLLTQPRETATNLFAAAADDEATQARSLIASSPARAALHAARARSWTPDHKGAGLVLDELATRGFQPVAGDPRVGIVEAELEQRPQDPVLLRKLANLHKGNNNPVLFVATLKRYLRVRPDDPLAVQQLTELLGLEETQAVRDVGGRAGGAPAPRPAISTANMVAGIKTGGVAGAVPARALPRPASSSATSSSPAQSSSFASPSAAPSFSSSSESSSTVLKVVVAVVALACVAGVVVVAKSAFQHTDDAVKGGLTAVERSQDNLSTGLTAATQQPFLERGDRALLLQDYEGAIDAYNFGIAADADQRGPLTGVLLWGRARARAGLGSPQQARLDLAKAIALAPPGAPWVGEARALLASLPKSTTP